MILKLPNAGDAATLTITGVEEVAAKNPNWSSQLRFDAGEDCLFVPIASATRQLGRLGMADPADAIGRTLVFSRSENASGGAPYWNIGLPDSSSAPKPRKASAAPTPTRTPTPAPIARQPGSPARWSALEQAYRHALRIAYQEVGQMPNATIADTVAAAATLFIQAAKLGLLTETAPAPAEAAIPAAIAAHFDAVPAPLVHSDDDGLPF